MNGLVGSGLSRLVSSRLVLLVLLVLSRKGDEI